MVSMGIFCLGFGQDTKPATTDTKAALTEAMPAASASPSASAGARRGARAPAPIPDNLDPDSLAAENAAKAGPVTWPSVAEPAAPVFLSTVDSTKHLDWAQTPPMGWNSWDCFGAGVWQADVFANAEYMDKNLKSHGWNLITIDIQWYEPLAHTTSYREGAWLITDAYGRLHPAPNRFPLTKDTGSFKPMADYLHAKGLKFGLHLMRGIPRQAVDRDNTPILGTPYHAADIVDKQNICSWNHDMYGVDMSKPGAQEYYNSVFKQMADWGLDFVKVDDLSGHTAEIQAIRKAIDQCGRPIVFSISPGGSSNDVVATNANMWRISGDFWDNWPALYNQFNLLNIGTPFRAPGHWPDADMIPFGNLNTFSATFTWTKFTHDEQVTLMTLWSIARSPLILGANLPKNDDATLALLTNDEVLAVDQKSTNNHQAYNQDNHIVWMADVPDSRDKYIAIFNANPAPPPGRGRRGAPAPAAPSPATSTSSEPADLTIALADLGLNGSYKVHDLWTHTDIGTIKENITAKVNLHGAVFYRLSVQ
jgi:alpha-galactosidase